MVALVALQHPQGRQTRVSKASAAATHPHTTSAAPSAAPTASATASARPSPSPAASRPPLVVLNNSTRPGLAQQARATFQSGGWTVRSVGNLSNNILSTCAYYDPSAAGAQAAAEALQAQFPSIKRVEPKFAQLPPGPIVVVLTSDYTTG